MNANTRNKILINSLESEDHTDDTYILPGDHPTYRIAYDESDWENGVKKKRSNKLDTR